MVGTIAQPLGDKSQATPENAEAAPIETASEKHMRMYDRLGVLLMRIDRHYVANAPSRLRAPARAMVSVTASDTSGVWHD